jgi:DnaK suppressor protein
VRGDFHLKHVYLKIPTHQNMNQEEIKDKILREIARTERAIEEYKEMSQPVSPDAAIGRVSRMDAINNKSVAESALRQAESKLKNLKYVLSKIGSADFGLCLQCRMQIPLGRVLYMPESLYCVNCAK